MTIPRPERLGIDLRSLALFRIALSVMMVMAAVDQGRWLIILAVLVLALLMLLGWQTRFVALTACLLFFLTSDEPPIELSFETQTVALYLFWAIFVPLGSCFGIDSALNSSSSPKPVRIWNVASMALGLQVLLLTFTLLLFRDAVVQLSQVAWGWVLFIPTALWNRIFHRLQTVPRMGLRIYYDQDCTFCKKSVLIIRTFFLLPETPLIPAQKDPALAAEMREHNSWILVDHKGGHHIKFEALAFVCQLSPLLSPLAPLLRTEPLASMGRWMYEQVAERRMWGSRLLKWMPYQSLRFQLSWAENLVVLGVLVYGLVQSFRALTG